MSETYEEKMDRLKRLEEENLEFYSNTHARVGEIFDSWEELNDDTLSGV